MTNTNYGPHYFLLDIQLPRPATNHTMHNSLGFQGAKLYKTKQNNSLLQENSSIQIKTDIYVFIKIIVSPYFVYQEKLAKLPVVMELTGTK